MSPPAPIDRPVSLVARLGLSITHPRWSFVIAADRKHAGRSGSDLLVLLGVVLAATQLRGLFGAMWLGSAIDMSLGVQAALRVLTGALTLDLAFLVISALVLWLLAGSRRDLGLAFDLACVAVLPLLYVELAAAVVVDAAGVEVPAVVNAIVSGIAFAWAGVLLALAVGPARAGGARRIEAVPPPAVVAPARRAGWAMFGLAVLGFALQLAWIVRNGDELRPMSHGDPAPAFALPAIEPGGKLGAPVALAASRGKVTVVEFWATWCGPCLKALPHLDALARKHPEVTILAVNLDDPAEASALWQAERYRMTLLADDGTVSSRYGVSQVPHVVVIDGAGMVRLVARGGRAKVEPMVEQILAEQIRN
ncbi:MAG TPA: TlpA disulfide reductase family protein [Kofleriaceae bacterium]|nr:TlpA disulfide reductase family protein [Kofleriaceae bacterium]